jgi:hypothetical protein
MNAQPFTPEADGLLTGSQLAIACGKPSMAVSRAISRGDIHPDFRAGGWSLFRPSRLAELRVALDCRKRARS